MPATIPCSTIESLVQIIVQGRSKLHFIWRSKCLKEIDEDQEYR